MWKPVEAQTLDLDGLRVAIVGGTGGIGRAFARLMASRGAHVTIVGRTFRDSKVRGITFIEADLSLMSNAQRVAQDLTAETLDILVFTTGIFAAPQRQQTAEGIERDMAVSYLNRLVMLGVMAPRLGRLRADQRRRPRVFLVAYPGSGLRGTPDDLNAEKRYKAVPQQMNTMAGNEILVLEAAGRYPQIGFYGFNPGLIATDIRRNFLGHNKLLYGFIEGVIGLFSKDVDTYAKRMVPLMVAPELEGRSGLMFNDKAKAILPSKGLGKAYREHFMAASEALVLRSGVRP